MRRLPLVLAAFLALLPAARAAEPLRWDVPRAFMSVPVHGEQEALGVPMRLTAVRSRASVQDLFNHFLRAFEKADLFVPPREGQFMAEGGLSLTGLDVERHVSYTVIFQPMPDGTTTVLLGEADLYRRKAPGDDGRIPVFPGAKGLLRSNHEGTATLTYTVRAPPGEVLRFYQETLGRAGFTASPEEPTTFVRDGHTFQVHLQRAHGPGEVSVVVFERNASAPAPPRRGQPGAQGQDMPR
jgi:hypothetical protein